MYDWDVVNVTTYFWVSAKFYCLIYFFIIGFCFVLFVINVIYDVSFILLSRFIYRLTSVSIMIMNLYDVLMSLAGNLIF